MRNQTPRNEKILQLLLVFAGGAAGTFLRFSVAQAFGFSMLPATLTVNVVGAFFLALLVSLLAHFGLGSTVRGRNVNLFFGTGLLGGFTTYSTFALDSASLYLSGEAGAAVIYGVLTLGLGGAATAFGLWVGAWRGKRKAAT